MKFTAPTDATSIVVQQSTDGITWTDSTTREIITAISNKATVINLDNTLLYQFRVVVENGEYAGISNVVTNIKPQETI